MLGAAKHPYRQNTSHVARPGERRLPTYSGFLSFSSDCGLFLSSLLSPPFSSL